MDNLNPTSTRIYVPRWMGITFLLLIPVSAILVGVFLYKTYGQSKLYNPNEQYGKLGNLGDTKISPGASDAQIAEVVQKRTNKETEGRLTLIFFYDGFDAQTEATNTVNVLKETLKELEPFKSMPDLLAYKIFTTDGKKCKVERNQLVCDPKLIESFRQLGVEHFKVILMSPEYFSFYAPLFRGSNSFISFSTFNKSNLSKPDQKRWLGINFAQLLGHSLGLSYESSSINSTHSAVLKQDVPPVGVPARALPKSGKPNCAPDKNTAEKWWGGYSRFFNDVSYFQGCEGNTDAFYPIKNTLMSDDPILQSYGQISEDYLRGVLSCFYGDKEAIIFPAGFTASHSATLKSCDNFKKDYPNFWKE